MWSRYEYGDGQTELYIVCVPSYITLLYCVFGLSLHIYLPLVLLFLLVFRMQRVLHRQQPKHQGRFKFKVRQLGTSQMAGNLIHLRGQNVGWLKRSCLWGFKMMGNHERIALIIRICVNQSWSSQVCYMYTTRYYTTIQYICILSSIIIYPHFIIFYPYALVLVSEILRADFPSTPRHNPSYVWMTPMVLVGNLGRWNDMLEFQQSWSNI